jgi:hypothetical protein
MPSPDPRRGRGGAIVLQDSKTALVTLDPAKAFGGSAFGPLRFRPLSTTGVAGDWQRTWGSLGGPTHLQSFMARLNNLRSRALIQNMSFYGACEAVPFTQRSARGSHRRPRLKSRFVCEEGAH